MNGLRALNNRNTGLSVNLTRSVIVGDVPNEDSHSTLLPEARDDGQAEALRRKCDV